MGIRGRLPAIERRLGLQQDRPNEEGPPVGFLMAFAGGELVDTRTGQPTTEAEAQQRYGVLFTMPDNGRDPRLTRRGQTRTEGEG